MAQQLIHCDEHGDAYGRLVCEHLLDGSGVGFFSDDDETDEEWPAAWCAACDQYIASVTDWEHDDFWQRLRVVCHRCYEGIRDRQLNR